MYNYDFKDEEVIFESVDNVISFDDKDGVSNILITKSKLLIFNNVKKNTVLSGRCIQEMPEYELLIEFELSKIKYEIDENNTIIKIDNRELILYNLDLNEVKR